MSPGPVDPCGEGELVLHAFLDGELDAVHAHRFEMHLAECPACRLTLERFRAQRARMVRDGVRWPVPDHLRRQVLDSLSKEALRAPGAPGWLHILRIVREWSFVPAALALAASLFLYVATPRDDVLLTREIVSSHVRSLLVDHLTDVTTSDQHRVRPWFAGKVEISPPVEDLSAAGYPLIGGRVDLVGGRTVPVLVYRRDNHVINVFVWPASQQDCPRTEQSGYAILPWTANGLDFCAISDVAPNALARLRDLMVAAR